eukprot:209005-Pyramimonas_sp.AAC.1
MVSRSRFNELCGCDGQISAGNVVNRCVVGASDLSWRRAPRGRSGKANSLVMRRGWTNKSPFYWTQRTQSMR